MAAKIQLTIHTDSMTQASASGTITDPKILEAARLVMGHLTDAAAGIDQEEVDQ